MEAQVQQLRDLIAELRIDNKAKETEISQIAASNSQADSNEVTDRQRHLQDMILAQQQQVVALEQQVLVLLGVAADQAKKEALLLAASTPAPPTATQPPVGAAADPVEEVVKAFWHAFAGIVKPFRDQFTHLKEA